MAGVTRIAPPVVQWLPWILPSRTQGTWSRSQSSGLVTGGSWSNGAPASPGSFSAWRAPLVEGDYRLSVMYQKNTNQGVHTWSVNGEDIGSYDAYNGSYAGNSVSSIDFSVDPRLAGHRELRVTVESKHASATHYGVAVQLVSLYRTDAAADYGALRQRTFGKLPHRADIIPMGGVTYSRGGAAHVATNETSSLGGGIWWNFLSAAINDFQEWLVLLDSGLWNITYLYAKTSASGVATWSVGGVGVGSVDHYAAATSYNNAATITSVNIPEPGVYPLRSTIASKHASSTGYSGIYHHIILQRTAAPVAPTIVSIEPIYQSVFGNDLQIIGTGFDSLATVDLS